MFIDIIAEKRQSSNFITLWGIKNTKFFHHNLKKNDPILIRFGTNISDTTGHQMTI